MTQDSDPVSLEYFKKQLWDLSKMGNDPKEDYYQYQMMVTQGKPPLDTEGKPFSFVLLRDKYFRYYTIWKAKFGARDPKFVGKADKLKSVADFILSDEWKGSHRFDDQLSAYLFGKDSIDIYEQRLKTHKSFTDFLSTRD